MYKQGAFWPCVITLDDVRAYARHYRRLDDALSLPTGKILRALTALWRTRETPAMLTMAPLPGETDVLWTSDPHFALDATFSDSDTVGAPARRAEDR